MNYPNDEIENILRQAPRPAASPALKQRLIEQVQLPPPNTPASSAASVIPSSGWLRKWWAALLPGMVSLAGAVVLTWQQTQIGTLQTTVQALRQGASSGPNLKATAPDAAGNDAPGVQSPANEQDEINRLKQVAADLSAAVSQLEQMQAENQKLRAQVASRASAAIPAEIQGDLEMMGAAKAKAQSIACVNNMKQIGLAFRIWSLDNGDKLPSTVAFNQGGAMLPGGSYDPARVFLVMSNELSTPKILVCPGESNRVAAVNWTFFTGANLSYQYVGATASEVEPNAVLAICPVHGNVLLCDGSVQMGVYQTHPEKFVQKDGKLYFGAPEASAPPVRMNRGRRGGPQVQNP